MTEIGKPAINRNIIGWMILSLPVILIVMLYVIPFFYGLGYSFTDSSVVQRTPHFVGFKNYTVLFANPNYLTALFNTFLSPFLVMRIILIILLPLSLAFLLLEMRSGARLTLQVLLCPLVCFSGPAVTAIFYVQYFSRTGLAINLTGFTQSAWESFYTGTPLTLVGSVHNILLANGLAFALPLGTALYMAAMRGASLMMLNQSQTYREFWSRSRRVLVACVIGVIGISLSGQENVFVFSNPVFGYENLISYSVKESFEMFGMSWGAAAIQLLTLTLMALGIVFILVLEGGKRQVAIYFLPCLRQRLFAGSAKNKGRTVLQALALAAVLLLTFLFVTVFLLPWIGGVTGVTSLENLAGAGTLVIEKLPSVLPEFFPAITQSFGLAALTTLLCYAVTAVSGFALGYLNPKGTKILLFVLGSFLFASPAIFFIPYYQGFKELGLLQNAVAAVIPCLLFPLGALLFTWFFRGLRDEKEALQARSGTLKRMVLPKHLAGLFIRFSLPVLGIYLLYFLNMIFMTYLMMPDEKNLLLVLLRMGPFAFHRYQRVGLFEFDMVRTAATNFAAMLFAPLQYLLPLILLILSAIFVFPRLALIIRRNGEAAPALDPAVIEKLKGE
jgi:ABC-type glycerol-3-phosphate transport system permease component